MIINIINYIILINKLINRIINILNYSVLLRILDALSDSDFFKAECTQCITLSFVSFNSVEIHTFHLYNERKRKISVAVFS